MDPIKIATRQTPGVTVILPVCNSARSLSRAIQSVPDQTHANIQLLIVDDGSTDDSLAVAQELATSDPHAEVILLAQNGGKARAMNHAATVACGRWIAVLDADDRYLPHRLAVLVEAGEANGVDLVADNQLHMRIASPELLPSAALLPHVICSPPVFAGGGEHEADQYDDTRRGRF